jgi:hypothetical protein
MKMKKKIFFIITSIIIFTSGCKDFLDVNHDPNNPSESTLQLVFPAGVEKTASIYGGSWLALGNIWSQYWTSAPNAPSYQGEDSYGITAGDYTYDLNGWCDFYTASLADFEWVKNEAKVQEEWNYYIMAVAMQCYTYTILADFFDKIPITEALQKVPAHFEDGQVVYDTIIARLDEALTHMNDENSEKPGKEDLVFNGNMDGWEAFINTLKLKMYLRQVYARPDVAQAGITKMFSDDVNFLWADAAVVAFTNEVGHMNYMYEAEFKDGNNNLKASKTLLDFLDEKNDYRLNYIYNFPSKPVGTEAHKAVYQGDYRNVYSDAPTTDEELSAPIVRPLTPTYFFSKAECNFLIAEACMRYDLIYRTFDDRSFYEMGIDADFIKLGVEGFTGSDVYTTGWAPYPVNATDEEKLEAIIVQKWIAMANTQGCEAFLEHNRTGYPKESSVKPGDDDFSLYVKGEFTASVNSVLAPPVLFPKRLLFPSSEQSRNPYVPAVVNLNVPVWWDRSNF